MGFGGASIILRPGFVEISLTIIAVLVGETFYALNAITVRTLGRTDSTAAMSFWFMVMVALRAGAFALTDWQTLRPVDRCGWV